MKQEDLPIDEIPKQIPPGDAPPEKKMGLTIIANEERYLEAKDFNERVFLAQAFFKAGMVPKSYKDSGSVFAGMEYAAQLGLPPLVGLRNIAVINGMPSVWGELPLALVRRDGDLVFFEEIIFDKEFNEISFQNKNINAEPYGGLCRSRRSDQKKDYETWFTMDDAKKAGLLGRDNVWKTYPRRMLQMRARSQNLKDQQPEVLLGISIAEYDFNTIPESNLKEVNVNFNGEEKDLKAKTINETLMGEE